MAPAETGAHLEEMVEVVRRAAGGRRRGPRCPGSASSPGSWPRRTPPSPATVVRLELDELGGVELRVHLDFSGMTTASALPDALSDAARSFAAGPAPPADRRRARRGRRRAHLRDARPVHRPADRRRRPGRRRGRGPRRPRRPRGVRGRSLDRHRRRQAHARDARARRRDRVARRRARRARVARQRQAGQARQAGRRGARGRAPALLRRLADQDRGRDAAGGPAPTCTATRARSRSACAGRSSPGTSRC